MSNHLQKLLTEFMLPPESPSRQQYTQSKDTCSSERDRKMQPVHRKQRARKRFAKYKLSWSKYATHSSTCGSKKVFTVIQYKICLSGTLGISNCITTYNFIWKMVCAIPDITYKCLWCKSVRVMLKMCSPTPLQLKHKPIYYQSRIQFI